MPGLYSDWTIGAERTPAVLRCPFEVLTTLHRHVHGKERRPSGWTGWRRERISEIADCPRRRSLCLAAELEDSRNLVNASFELGDRQRFLKKRKWASVLTHRLIVIDAPPLCVHRDLCAICAAMETGRNKAWRSTY
jgi:hypothetical protein